MRIHPILLFVLFLVVPDLPAQQADKIRDFSFDLESLGGQSIRAEDFRDNVLIVDFWGTWCPPCRQALPGMMKLYKKYKHRGLEIVGLNYENMNDLEAAAEKVRDFAAEVGITYQLAMGTEEVQGQVPRFSGYPTMLLFKRGLEHDRTVVGYTKGHEDRLETWIRGALGYDEGLPIEPESGPPGKEVAEGQTMEETEEEAAEEVPEGLIYLPGDGDKGFGFELEDDEGQTLAFEDLRGKPVVLAITSTWDEEAEATTKFLIRINERYAERGAVVLAACIELESNPTERLASIHAFRKQHGLTYRILPIDLSFTRTRIHGFAGLPLLLVFDAGGTLVLRETGSSPAIHASVEAAIDDQLEGR